MPLARPAPGRYVLTPRNGAPPVEVIVDAVGMHLKAAPAQAWPWDAATSTHRTTTASGTWGYSCDGAGHFSHWVGATDENGNPRDAILEEGDCDGPFPD